MDNWRQLAAAAAGVGGVLDEFELFSLELLDAGVGWTSRRAPGTRIRSSPLGTFDELFAGIAAVGAVEAAALEHHAHRVEQFAQPARALRAVVRASSVNACTASKRSSHRYTHSCRSARKPPGRSELISTLPSQVLEPLCGPCHSRTTPPTPAGRADPHCAADRGRGRRPRGGGRAVDAVPIRPVRRAVTDLDRRLRRPGHRRFRPARPRPRTLGPARAALAALPVKGWDRTRIQAVPIRQGLERRRQRRVRSQRVQHPRRHPAPRPGRPGGAARHLLRQTRNPTRPVQRERPSPSSADRTPPTRWRSTTWCRWPTPGTKGARVGRPTSARLRQRPRNLLAVSPKANFDKAFRDAASWLPPNRRSGAIRRPSGRGQDRLRAVGSAKEKRAMAEVLNRC